MVQRPLDLWNRMFDRHQVEITVMQFTGHSLPVHQSMSVPWEFFSSSHFISQFPPTRFPHITAIGMCHFHPVHHLEWHFARAEGQNITDWGFRLYHHITYICNFVVSYLFLLWYDWFLLHCFALQAEEIQFLSQGFSFLDTFMFSYVRCCLLVA